MYKHDAPRGRKCLETLPTFRIVLYSEDGVVYAHCLETNLVGHGKNEYAAEHMLFEHTFHQWCFALNVGEGEDTFFFPANDEIRAMFFNGKVVDRTYQVENFLKNVISGYEIRDYRGFQ